MARDNWKTPTWLKEFFKDYYDPCLLETNTIHPIDTLGSSWGSPAFVNPPYSNPLPWVKKAIAESLGGVDVVLLLNVDPSTEWYKLLYEANAHFCYFNERLRFDDVKGASDRPSMLIFLEGKEVTKEKDLSQSNLIGVLHGDI